VNLLAARISLRPRPLADVLDLALPFCAANRRPLAVLALLTLGPVAAGAAYLRLRAGWSWPQVWFAIAWPALLAEGAFTIALGELLFRPPGELRVRTVLGRWARRLLPYAFTRLLRLGMLAASAVLVVALPFAGPPFLFVPEAVLLEGARAGQAFGRSRALAKHRGFPCLGLWLAVMVIPVLGAIVADLLGNAITWKVLLGVPVAAAARFLGYTDLRTRKEGWDIQLRFMAAAAEAEDDRRRVA
jgi:hypothetical protein